MYVNNMYSAYWETQTHTYAQACVRAITLIQSINQFGSRRGGRAAMPWPGACLDILVTGLGHRPLLSRIVSEKDSLMGGIIVKESSQVLLYPELTGADCLYNKQFLC